MIILDTNVISELTLRRPARQVIDWLDAQPAGDVFTTSVNVAELVFGVVRKPLGARRSELTLYLSRFFDEVLADRILPFDGDAAVEWGHLRAERLRAGRSYSDADLQIAAIALTTGAVVVTRNLDDFDHPGLRVVDPWRA